MFAHAYPSLLYAPHPLGGKYVGGSTTTGNPPGPKEDNHPRSTPTDTTWRPAPSTPTTSLGRASAFTSRPPESTTTGSATARPPAPPTPSNARPSPSPPPSGTNYPPETTNPKDDRS